MALKGRKPKPAAARVNNHPPVHEWVEVPNIRFKGGPKVPRHWPRNTQIWFGIVRSMPHAALWGPEEWAYAFEAAQIHMKFYDNPRDTRWSVELRRREAEMGFLWTHRRNMRIRWIDVETNEEVDVLVDDEEEEDNVVSIDDFKRSIV